MQTYSTFKYVHCTGARPNGKSEKKNYEMIKIVELAEKKLKNLE